MTAAVALALGADSVVVPVRSAAEARAVRAACSYKGSRALNIGPELPYHVAKVPAAGIELLCFPAIGDRRDHRARPISSWPRPPTSFWPRAASRRSRASRRCRRSARSRASRFSFLMTRRPRPIHRRIGVSNSISDISLPPSPPAGEDAHLAAQNARLADFKLALRRGDKSIGQVVCAASPAVAAAYVAFGVDWVWIEWQHSCQDAAAIRAQVAAIAQRGGLSVARTAGAHDKTGIQQCLDAGVDIVLDPLHQYRRGGEGVDQALPLRAPRRPRVERQRALPLEEAGRDVPARDLRLHGCARGDMPAARDGFRLRRTRRPGHVDGARDARFVARIHEGGRAQVVLSATSWRPATPQAKSPADSRVAATRRPCCRTASRWLRFRTTSWTPWRARSRS